MQVTKLLAEYLSSRPDISDYMYVSSLPPKQRPNPSLFWTRSDMHNNIVVTCIVYIHTNVVTCLVCIYVYFTYVYKFCLNMRHVYTLEDKYMFLLCPLYDD
jgi:hypothetical protein